MLTHQATQEASKFKTEPFNMYGGTISGCESYFSTGGGVRVYGTGGKAVFNMYGGIIEDNKALKGIYNSYS